MARALDPGAATSPSRAGARSAARPARSGSARSALTFGMPTLHLSPPLLDELKARCEEAYPFEACGLLLGERVPREGKGPKAVVRRVHPARNLNAAHPEPRFHLDPADFAAADALARRERLEILGVYHSHPDRPESPSAEDAEQAQAGWAYVIVAVRGDGRQGSGRAASWRAFSLEQPTFREDNLCIC